MILKILPLVLSICPVALFSQQLASIQPVAGEESDYREQPATQALLQSPSRVLSAGSNGFYFGEPNGRVFRVDATGTLRSFANVNAPGAFQDTDSNGVYYYSTGPSITRISPDGGTSTLFNFLNDPSLSALRNLSAIAVNGTAASLFVANNQGVFSLPGGIFLSGSAAARSARRLYGKGSGPFAIAASGVQVLAANGCVLAGSGERGTPVEGQSVRQAPFLNLVDLLQDGGRFYVADSGNRSVYRIDEGTIRRMAGLVDGVPAREGLAARDAKFVSIDSIAVDSTGRLLIADPGGQTVWSVGNDGLLRRAAGRVHESTGLSDPSGLAYDAEGTLYIVDRLSFRILAVRKNESITVAAGNGEDASAGDGGAAINAAIRPAGPIATQQDGFVYFLDAGGSIRRFRRGGNIETWLSPAELSSATLGFFGIAAAPRGGLVVSNSRSFFHVSPEKQIEPLEVRGYPVNDPLVRFAVLDDGSIVFSTVAEVLRRDPSGATAPVRWPAEAFLCRSSETRVASAGNDFLTASTSAICRFSVDGSFRLLAGGRLGSPSIPDGGDPLSGALSNVIALAYAPDGSVVFAERTTNRVRRFVPGSEVQLTSSGVVNAASLKGGGVSPGMMVSIFGQGIGPDTPGFAQLDTDQKLQTVVSETRVWFNNIPAPLTYVSSGQINAIVPYGVAGSPTAEVAVQYRGARSDAVTLPVVTAMPGIFTSDGSGRGQGLILNENSKLNGTGNASPAQRGSIIVFFATGEGATTPVGVDGQVAVGVFTKPNLPVSVKIGGLDAEVLYAGAAPSLVAGVLQINARVPSGVPDGTAVPIQIQVGEAQSQIGVTVAIAGDLPK